MQKFNIEKVSDYNYFLIIVSFVVFIDTYFIFFMNMPIIKINFSILKDNFGHFLVMLLFYSMFMAVIGKVVSHVLNFIYELKFKTYYNCPREDYMFDSDVLNLSIKTNNSTLFNYYLNNKQELEIRYKNQYLSTSVILIFVCNYFVSTESVISIMRIYELFTNNSEWYYIFINIIPIGLIIYISKSIFEQGELYYIYLDKNVQDYLNSKIEPSNLNNIA